ncbi:hypothetical protein SAMN05216228_1001122 [Rhizobium tibeticum]|uniref:Uncharacterized protein n=1 Tax=Rhizobium tibeticum TaxID=501024 RepID=A0A1H8CEU8_9HYPH|nr:hypothetical protein RTCCBAU85039_0570 [Rhizobium tibeticum]SEM93520.1 hypothetical protein SAMN05216228_1001122 [Rhizobium tibeticum]
MQVIRNRFCERQMFYAATIAFVAPLHTWKTFADIVAKDGKWPDF